MMCARGLRICTSYLESCASAARDAASMGATPSKMNDGKVQQTKGNNILMGN
jgi:hypothetical protein